MWARILEKVGVHILVGLFISLACLWLFSALADEIKEETALVSYDRMIVNTFHENATPAATQFFLVITRFGSEIVWIITIPTAIYLLVKQHHFQLIMLIIAVGGGQFLNSSLKLLFDRPRPFFENPIITALFPSFPSGHAMMAMILYGLLAYFLVIRTPVRPRKHLIITAAVLLIGLIGLSRIYLGVHYLSDVVAGFAAGGLWLSTCITALNFLRQRRGWKVPPKLENQHADNPHR